MRRVAAARVGRHWRCGPSSRCRKSGWQRRLPCRRSAGHSSPASMSFSTPGLMSWPTQRITSLLDEAGLGLRLHDRATALRLGAETVVILGKYPQVSRPKSQSTARGVEGVAPRRCQSLGALPAVPPSPWKLVVIVRRDRIVGAPTARPGGDRIDGASRRSRCPCGAATAPRQALVRQPTARCGRAGPPGL